MFAEIVALFPKDTVTQAETKRQNRIIKQMRRNPILRLLEIIFVVLAFPIFFTVYAGTFGMIWGGAISVGLVISIVYISRGK